MEKIPTVSYKTETSDFDEKFGKANNLINTKKQKTVKSLISYGGLVLSVLIVIAFMIISTTHLKFQEIDETWNPKDALISLFVYIFAVISVHISASDSGTRAGLLHPEYQASTARYSNFKAVVVENDYHAQAIEFCENYTKEEQIRTRRRILADVGITYDLYIAKYIGMDTKELEAKYPNLTKMEKKYIQKANDVKQIHLTPEMLMKRGRAVDDRNPLGISPEKKRIRHFAFLFARTLIISTAMSLMIAEVIMQPSWATFAEAVYKSVVICVQGALGYKYGYDNIVTYTAGYIDDQSDLLDQMIKYAEEHPAKQEALCETTKTSSTPRVETNGLPS